MRIFNFKMTGRKAAFAAVGVIVGAGAGGTAYAATGSGGPSGPSHAGVAPMVKRAHPRAHPRARTLLQRSDHSTLELKVKGQWITYTLDRGKVASISPTSITLTRPDGQTVTDTINSSTRFGGVTSESAVQLNRPAAVLSEAGTALRIHQGKPPAGTGQPAGTGS